MSDFNTFSNDSYDDNHNPENIPYDDNYALALSRHVGYEPNLFNDLWANLYQLERMDSRFALKEGFNNKIRTSEKVEGVMRRATYEES
ncbi:16311_t:CDS:2 [Funneliformis mosseae]|uniref:16311_t:CDS:1 n=1 Tax=Funneliformis mosseae TaxID=27381 RepID=A0A9N9GPH0_FUNMO|nr:16311_t:CDS:2 [Funneliformis mosseae]